MIPQHVLKHWQAQGRAAAWIEKKVRFFLIDKEGQNQPKRRLLPDIKKLLELHKSCTLEEIGGMYNCSAELVRMTISTHPDYRSWGNVKLRNRSRDEGS